MLFFSKQVIHVGYVSENEIHCKWHEQSCHFKFLNLIIFECLEIDSNLNSFVYPNMPFITNQESQMNFKFPLPKQANRLIKWFLLQTTEKGTSWRFDNNKHKPENSVAKEVSRLTVEVGEKWRFKLVLWLVMSLFEVHITRGFVTYLYSLC